MRWACPVVADVHLTLPALFGLLVDVTPWVFLPIARVDATGQSDIGQLEENRIDNINRMSGNTGMKILAGLPYMRLAPMDVH